jgi:hypothetical protein
MTPNSTYRSIHGCASSGRSRGANSVLVTLAISAGSSSEYLARMAPLARSLSSWFAHTAAA